MKTPKLHFLDSGLCCHLLGIQNAGHLRQHPLRGAIFESWVVSEVLKVRRHHGLPARLGFYRDRSGHEVDLIVEKAEGPVSVEIKSGQTVAGDFFAELERFATLAAGGREKALPVLVYGGGERQQRRSALVLPWEKVDEGPWV